MGARENGAAIRKFKMAAKWRCSIVFKENFINGKSFPHNSMKFTILINCHVKRTIINEKQFFFLKIKLHLKGRKRLRWRNRLGSSTRTSP